MKFILFFLSLTTSSLTFAASCCGGGFSFPALILGDDKAQVTSSISYGRITDEVLPDQKWIHRNDDNESETFKIEAAALLTDTIQVGATVPLVSRRLSDQTSSGLGDVSLSLGHETFPELTYSAWKPKGVTFLQITLPTSPSVYDAQNPLAVDSRGRGFFALGAGLALQKNFGVVWDANASGEVHRAFARSFSSEGAGGTIDASPGWGNSVSLGVGWNRGDFRLGTSMTALYEDPVKITGVQSSDGSFQKNITWSVVANYMLNLESAVTLAYADQTLFGEPANSSLSKAITVSYQKRWQR